MKYPQLLLLALFGVSVLSQSASDYNGNCAGCVYNNYTYTNNGQCTTSGGNITPNNPSACHS